MKRLFAYIFCGNGKGPAWDRKHPLAAGLRNLLYFWILSVLLYIAIPVYPLELTTFAVLSLFAGLPALAIGIIGHVRSGPVSCWGVALQRLLSLTVSTAAAFTMFLFFRRLCLLWQPAFDLYWVLISGGVFALDIAWHGRLRKLGILGLFTPVLLYVLGFAVSFYLHYAPSQGAPKNQPYVHTILSSRDIKAFPKIGDSVIYDLRVDTENHLILASLKSRWDGYFPVMDSARVANGYLLLDERGKVLDFLPLPSIKGCSRAEDLLLFPKHRQILTFISERSKPHSLVLIGYMHHKLTFLAKKSTGSLEPIGLVRMGTNQALVLFSNARVWRVRIRPLTVIQKGGWTDGSPFADKIAVSHKLNRAFITFRSGGAGMILLSDLSPQGRLSIRVPTSAILIEPGTRFAYISAYQDHEVLKVDLTTGKVIRRSRAPAEPRGLALDSDGRVLTVSGYADGLVCLYDTRFLMSHGCVSLGGLARPLSFLHNQVLAAGNNGLFSIDFSRFFP